MTGWHVYDRALGWVLAVLGGFFTVAGGTLAALGGSVYYLIAGIAMIASGALLGRGRPPGRLLFALVWAVTLAWAIWESGTDVLRLMPRVVAPTVLLAAVYLPVLFRAARRPAAARTAGAVAALLALMAVGGLALHQPSANATQGAPAPMAAPVADAGDWPAYGGTVEGRRFSALADITPANVDKLQVAWTAHTGDLPAYAEAVTHEREYHSESTPIHVGDTLYTCTPHSWVQAVDATTGRIRWLWKLPADVKGNSYLVCRGVSYYATPASAACPARVFAPTFDARVVALNAVTGTPCADFGDHGYINLRDNMGASPAAMQISTSPPLVTDDRLVVAERIRDNYAVDEPSGVIRAYDPVTGRGIWAWDVGRSEDAIAPLPPGQIYTRGTPNAWGPLTADPKNGIVYFPMGNATPDYWTGKRRPFDDRFGTSITALDIRTGKLKWTRQLVHHDEWDMDLAIGPSLVDLPAPGGGTVPALVQTTKMGQVYLLNRLTGAAIATVEEKPVVTRGGMHDELLSPTQPFSTGMPSFTPPPLREVDAWGATPIDQLLCRIDYRKSRVTGIYVPIGLTPAIGHPAFDGVTDWGGAAVDPERGVMTVNTMEMPFKIQLFPRDGAEAKAYLARKAKGGESARAPSPYTQYQTPYVAVVQAWLGVLGAPCSAPPWGKLTAIDLKTHKVLWDVVLGTARDSGLFGSHLGVPLKTGVPNLGGSIITRGGVVFIGATTDQYLRAFDVNSGRELWKGRLPAGAQATPMTYRGTDGRQYVVITAGGHGALGTRYSDQTIAYALPRGA